MNFDHLSGIWSLFIDASANAEYDFKGDPTDLNNYIHSQFGDRLDSDFDGFFWIINLDSDVHRFRLVPENELSTYTLSELENPTFMAHEDGSLTFCLAANTDI